MTNEQLIAKLDELAAKRLDRCVAAETREILLLELQALASSAAGLATDRMGTMLEEMGKGAGS